MDVQTEQKLRREFTSLLLLLAKQDSFAEDKYKRSNIYQQLENLYWNNGDKTFRHYYSDIFSVLTMIKQDSSLGSIDTLCVNLSIAINGYRGQNKDSQGNVINIEDRLKKLYDHVNLEVSHMRYFESVNRENTGEKSINEMINKTETYYQEIRQKQEGINSKIMNQQKEHIAILGIFAAVVFAFNGGMVYSASVLNNIGNVTMYRLGFAILSIGWILYNALWMVLNYLATIIDKTRGFGTKAHCFVNGIFLLLMICVTIAWYYHFIELRNMLCS